MDDLEDLQSRVAAAQEKLRMNADDQRKYGLRLNDVVAIVEGSLARQQEEMQRLQASAIELRVERDAARHAEAELKAAYDAALTKIAKRETQNEQLRNMVLTLLNIIEGREPASALQDTMMRLEQSLQQVIATQQEENAESAAMEAGEEPSQAAALAAQLEEAVAGDDPAVDSADMQEDGESLDAAPSAEKDAAEMAGADAISEDAGLGDQSEPQPASELQSEIAADEPAVEEAPVEELTAEEPIIEETVVDEPVIEEPANEEPIGETVDQAQVAADLSDDMPEDLEQISMTDHQTLVSDPEEADEKAADKTAQPLVTALLDAEKALIEAGANGLSDGDSPVAEIIRRISLRTREFSQAANR
ncbi:hypothetical protein ACFPL7_01735 [Dongia soli]|uniref:Uncharacterized protein n=1 Tax=Dongia soli TaxID=600628 RepID=A0ABU5EDD7_9PROT|nr:hypothetical protein [Dongia soli]MDY0884172.1 hypothetical protein [Dongia soli]